MSAAPIAAPLGAIADASLPELNRALDELRQELIDLEIQFDERIRSVPVAHVPSARNLVHYVALRRRDLRELQDSLVRFGLSSLGRSEPHVLANLSAVLGIVRALQGEPGGSEGPLSFLDAAEARQRMADRTEQLLGPRPLARDVRLMVTMPSEAAQDYMLVRRLLAAGMDCMRINCAHDDEIAWERMVINLRRACEELERPCRVLMDLAGPKVRTASMESGPQVVKWRPKRNAFGRLVAPARVWLTPAAVNAAAPGPADASVPLINDWVSHLRVGDRISFTDARGKKRGLTIVGETKDGRWAESEETAYVVPGTMFKVKRRNGVDVAAAPPLDEGRVAALPPITQSLLLRPGDTLVLTDSSRPGTPALHDADGELTRPAMIGCTLSDVFQHLGRGDRVLLDDGRIAGVITAVDDDQVQVKITRARENGDSLGANKGINLPDSTLKLPALTPKDVSDLPAVARLADMVGYSAVRRPEDVDVLRAELSKLKAEHLGVVLKIENKQAFDQLPDLLLSVMQCPLSGVMIARGDLAVECGYERLAEVQEEILWMCEAAHLPVIWATQVLESLAKDGLPSRAEITDAAMSERAECVMLNKGPFITEALALLDDILRRMAGHQQKKRPMLRRLEVAHRAASPK